MHLGPKGIEPWWFQSNIKHRIDNISIQSRRRCAANQQNNPHESMSKKLNFEPVEKYSIRKRYIDHHICVSASGKWQATQPDRRQYVGLPFASLLKARGDKEPYIYFCLWIK